MYQSRYHVVEKEDGDENESDYYNKNIEHVDTVWGDYITHVVHVTHTLHYCATYSVRAASNTKR